MNASSLDWSDRDTPGLNRIWIMTGECIKGQFRNQFIKASEKNNTTATVHIQSCWLQSNQFVVSTIASSFFPSLFCLLLTYLKSTNLAADRWYIVRFAVCFMQNIQRKYVNMLALWNKLVAKIDVRPNIYSDVNFWIIRYLLMHISCIRWNDIIDCDKVKNQSHIVAAAICSHAIHSINISTFFPIYPYSFFSLCVNVCIFC